MSLLSWALVLFVLGALGGLAMAAMSFKGKPIPVLLAAGHGLLAASGLVLVIIAVLAGAVSGLIKVALGLLLIAALGGFYLLSFHVRKQTHPRAVIGVHAVLAAAGVVCLLVALLPAA